MRKLKLFFVVSIFIGSLNLTAQSLNIGDKAPELAFNNPKEEVLILSSLQGKYVIIDFWASWCGWQSEGAATYNIRSIPQTYIIDGKGMIIAKNLKGNELTTFLNSKKLK